MVYLRDRMTRTPSLANPMLLTTPPGTLCLAPLHGILPDMSQPTSTSTATRSHECLKQEMLCCCVKIPPVFASLALAVLHSSIVPTRFESRFSMGFDSGFPDSIWLNFLDRIWLGFSRISSTQYFLLHLTQFFLTRFDPRFLNGFDSVFLAWFNSQFLTGFDPIFLVQFDSRLTRLIMIRVTSFGSHSIQVSEVPHWQGFFQNNSILKSWNIPQFWELKLALARTL